jgi:hypothetical protein
MSLRAPRLGVRILNLRTEAIAAEDSAGVKSILHDSQSAIHQCTQRLRNRATAILTGRNVPPERRKNSHDGRKAATP